MTHKVEKSFLSHYFSLFQVIMHTTDGLNIPIFDGSTDKTTGTPVNLASAWLDGSVIYGISAEHESKLRAVFK